MATRSSWTPRTSEGQAAIMMTMALLVICGLIGLVVDAGWASWRREACKTASEAAAIGAIMALSSQASFTSCTGAITCQADTACPASPPSPPSNNIGNGCLYAKQNGFVNSGRQTVSIQANIGTAGSPPVSGYSPNYWVTATVGEQLPQTFSSVLGNFWLNVRAQSTAGIYLKPTGACIYSLDPTSSGAFTTKGTPDVEASCGVYVDSSSGSALQVKGNATINASTIKIVGGYSTNGNPTLSPTPTTSASYTPDPLAGISPPTVPNRCDDGGGGIPSNPVMPVDGIYVACGGFSMSGNPTVNLPAGTYVLKGGSMDLHNGTLTGSGVTLYFKSPFSSITINGNVDINLSAPSSGGLKGVLMYADRSYNPGDLNVKINGGSDTLLNGSLYFPTTDIEYAGGANTTNTYTALITWQVTFVGNSYFAADSNGVHTGIGVPQFGLIQ